MATPYDKEATRELQRRLEAKLKACPSGPEPSTRESVGMQLYPRRESVPRLDELLKICRHDLTIVGLLRYARAAPIPALFGAR
jgi:hypothetical protein